MLMKSIYMQSFSIKKIKPTLLDASIWLLIVLTVIYLASSCVRNYVEGLTIDAGILSGVVASLALLFAIKQSFLTYNLTMFF